MIYLQNIYFGIAVFAVVAFILTLPYLTYTYFKYGSVVWKRALLVYGFVLYAICAYFMVILPLPSIEEVSKMTGPTMQLIPFSVVKDFIEHTVFRINDPRTYLAAMKQGVFTQPVFNLLLTIPFGVFMRRLFNLDFKKTAIASFILALFFELTQLSGLYGIYPRAYRLFDVDDLMLNTIGGMLGYGVSPLFNILFISKAEMIQEAQRRSVRVSIIRRFVSYALDLVIVGGIMTLLGLNHGRFWPQVGYIAYTMITTSFLKGATLGMRITNTKIVSSKPHLPLQILLRTVLFVVLIVWIPGFLNQFFLIINNQPTIDTTLNISMVIVILGYFGILAIHYAWIIVSRHNVFMYEKLSHTTVQSSFIENTSHK